MQANMGMQAVSSQCIIFQRTLQPLRRHSVRDPHEIHVDLMTDPPGCSQAVTRAGGVLSMIHTWSIKVEPLDGQLMSASRANQEQYIGVS